MKIVVLFCLLVVATTGYASFCNRTSDCKVIACNQGFRLTCYRDHVCTCVADSSLNCTQASQCEHAFSSCRYGDHHWHCVDNKCMCRIPDHN